jgi:hypothetical protein
MDNAENFTAFREQVDSYLFPDLETMLAAEGPGGCGYPMVQTILSSMELVGVLISDRRKAKAFGAFFDEFETDHPAYAPARDVLYRAVRHKTAHLYLLHAGLSVSKDGRGNLTVLRGRVNIDLETLYEDFRETYERLMDEIAHGRDAPGLPTIFEELTGLKKEIAELAAQLEPYPLAVPTIRTTPNGIEVEHGGTIGFRPMPAASATNFPFPTEDERRP